MASENVIKGLAVVCELTGTELSKAALSVMAEDLSMYPEPQVLGALQRCRRELRGRLTLAEVILRLDDGRPGAEEAWGMVPLDEGQTVVWTQEMVRAFTAAAPLLERGDKVAARMAFVESYKKLVADARDRREIAVWDISLGWDLTRRDKPLLHAVQCGRLTHTDIAAYLPPPEKPMQKLLEGATTKAPETHEYIARLRETLNMETKDMAKPIRELTTPIGSQDHLLEQARKKPEESGTEDK